MAIRINPSKMAITVWDGITFYIYWNKHRQQHEYTDRHDKGKDHNNGHKDAF